DGLGSGSCTPCRAEPSPIAHARQELDRVNSNDRGRDKQQPRRQSPAAEPGPNRVRPAPPSPNPESRSANPDLAAGQSPSPARPANPQAADLGVVKEGGAGQILTTNQGTPG